jgi:Asp-tRNA(Asn)/Glu-tRNA(Gln) amidotransferase A subunit family amidase
MASNELTFCSLVELASLVRSKEVSPVDLVSAHLRRIENQNGAVNAIVTIAPDVLEQARRAEALTMRGEPIGPLHGVPLTIKDTVATAGIRTTSGSRARQDFIPTADATAVARLKAAGAIILAKTNTPEMAIPYETDNPIFGRTNNPYDERLTSGGSSGGEAAAIAAWLSPGGVGSDLSGSIRVPAHFCGIVGLKPTSGRIPMDGHVPIARGTLANGACLGPMARTVADVSLLFRVLAGIEGESSTNSLTDSDQLKGFGVCWYDYDGVTPVSPDIRIAVGAAVEALDKAGLRCFEKQPPAVSEGSRLWVELFAESSANDLREFYSGCEALAGPLARKILDTAGQRTQRGPEESAKAHQERSRLRGELLAMMESTPLIVAPVGATAAFPHNTSKVSVDGESVSVFRAFSYAQTFNVFDLPAVVVRAGSTAAGLPLGVQIVGRPLEEQTVLNAAAIIEASLGTSTPPAKFEY